MLGRLRMSTADALKAYPEIAKRMFQTNKRNKDGLFNEDTLANAIRRFLTDLDEDQYNGEERMLEDGEEKRIQLGNRYVNCLPNI